MPRIKKLSAAQNSKRDEIAQALLREGASKQKAYAVSAAQAERLAGVRPKLKKRRKR